jgi:peptidoglycan/xylan/chitin deacetylase (PgdA/CDA1 family)
MVGPVMKLSAGNTYERHWYHYGIRRRIRHWKNSIIDRKPKLLILVYHRIMPTVSFNPLHTIVSVRTFEAQLEAVAERYSILPLRDVIQQKAKPTRDQVVITFDDGYRDNYQFAFPILKKRGIPATFFVVTGAVNTGMPLWDWELVTRLCTSKDINEVELRDVVLRRKTKESCQSFAKRAIEHLKSASLDELQQVQARLRGHSAYVDPSELTSCLTWEELRTMSKSRMEIGAHGVTHRSLPGLAHAEALHEILRSKQTIEENTFEHCRHFAFPFGSRLDYNEALLRTVKEAGFQTCMLNVSGYNNNNGQGFCFKRTKMSEFTDVRHLLG